MSFLKNRKSLNKPHSSGLHHKQLSQMFQECRDEFDSSIQLWFSSHDQALMMRRLKDALNACLLLPRKNSLDFIMSEYEKADAFRKKYVFSSFKNHLWISNQPVINDMSTSILCDLSALVIDAGWVLFEGLHDDLESMDSDHDRHRFNCTGENTVKVLDILFCRTMEQAKVYLTMAHKPHHLNSSGAEISFKSVVNEYVKKSDDSIRRFLIKARLKGALREGNTFQLNKILSIGNHIRAALEIADGNYDEAELLLNKCDEFNKKYEFTLDYSEALLLYFNYKPVASSFELLHKLRDVQESKSAEIVSELSGKKTHKKKRNKHKKIHNVEEQLSPELLLPVIDEKKPEPEHDDTNFTSTVEHRIDVVSPCVSESTESNNNSLEPLQTDTYESRIKEKKRLKKITKNEKKLAEFGALVCRTERLPVCYGNNDGALKILLDEISTIFNMSSCDGFMFGSGNIKKNPGDFDIFIPNIKSNEDLKKVEQLIGLFLAFGGVVTARNPVTGEYGYRVGDRYTIPMKWAQFKLDFNISDKMHFVEHALETDFSVGALYYNFREKSVYQLNAIHSWDDLDNRILNTISEPMKSFSLDPRRIFRGIRLIASEGFDFSKECKDAIESLLLDGNIFKDKMSCGELNNQLKQLFNSGFERENIAVLDKLGLLPKLLDCLSERTDEKAMHYWGQLKAFYEGEDRLYQVPSHYRADMYHLGFFQAATALTPAQNIEFNPQNDRTAPLNGNYN